MSAREVLDGIKARIADCRSYNFGMRNADKLAHEDAARLTAAVEAVLALHQREVLAVHEGYGEEAWCANCREHWPCEEYAAIENALEPTP